MTAHRPPDERARTWVAAELGAEPVGAQRLTGGITADVDRLTFAGGRDPVVLRRWTDPGTWPERLVEREAAGLTALADHGGDLPFAAPRLLAADPAGDRAGVPALVMTQVAGTVDLTPRDSDAWLIDLARALAAVHRLPPTLTARVVHETVAPDLAWVADPGLRREAHDVVASAASATGDDVFAHGDYQHFNVLWDDGRLTAVVDWPNAGTGPRGRDVGHCCLNLAVLFDAATALAFLRDYEQQAQVTVDPVVVARAVLAWEPDWVEFIPRQVAGRAAIDGRGMAERATTAFRCILQRLG